MASWRENLAHDPSLRRIADWPPVSLNHLTASGFSNYRRRYRAVALVLEGKTLEIAAKQSGISKGQVSKLLDRCLGTDPERLHPALSWGLVPGARLREPRRDPRDPIKSGAGAFQAFLSKHPSIREHLDDILLADLRNRPGAQRQTPRSFHQEFIEMAKQLGTLSDEYPFTTQFYGQETCRQYFHRRRKVLDPRPKRQTTRPDAHRPRITPNELLHVVELDEHTIDAESATRLEIDVQRIFRDLRVPRFMLVLAVDLVSTGIVGVAFSFSKNPTEYGLLRCLDSIENGSRVSVPRWLKSTSIANCLPQDEHVQAYALPGELRIDNALAHHSLQAHRVVCERWGSILNFGLPALPLARQMVELTFRNIETHIHRLRSTSGTSVTDPNRESSSLKKRPPKASIELLIEMVYRVVRAHNNKPVASFGNRTPIQYLLESAESGWLRRTRPAHLQSPPLWRKRVERTVKSYGEASGRVNLLYVMYRGDCLTSRFAGQPVIVEYDVRDVRDVDVYSTKGSYMGKLYAPRRWLKHPHSEKERISACRDNRRMVAQSGDPIGDLYKLHVQTGGKSALKALTILDESHSVNTKEVASHINSEDARPRKQVEKKKRFTLRDR